MKDLYKIIFSIAILTGFAFALDAKAQGYVPLAPIPGLNQAEELNLKDGTGLSKYLGNMYKFGVGIASALAVIMIMWGGIEYMSTDAMGGKEEGKERISNALLGLLLALGSFLFVRTINSDFINTTLSITEVRPPSAEEVLIKNNTTPRIATGNFNQANYDLTGVEYTDGNGIPIGGGPVEVDFDGSPGAYKVEEVPAGTKGAFLINGKYYKSVGIEYLQNAKSDSGKWVGVQTDASGNPIINPDGTLNGTLSIGSGKINGDTTPFVALSSGQLAKIKETNPAFKLGDNVILSANGKSIKAVYADYAGTRSSSYSEVSPAALKALGINFNNKGTDGTSVKILLPSN